MQPQQPPFSHFYADSPTLRSRTYVQLFAWFGLLIAFLHLIQGRSFALIHIPLCILGIYASWDDVISRKTHISIFAIGCLIWTIFDVLFFFALLVSTNETLRKTTVAIVTSNTFPNLGPELDKLFTSLAADAHFFVFFSAITGFFFDAIAAYWSFALQNDVVAIQATSSSSQIPLSRPPTAPSRVASPGGFGTFSRLTQSTQTSPRTLHPFAGRGFRLGAGDP